MSGVGISATSTEPITFTWLQDGAAVTGGSPTLRVRRYSDGFTTTLDFDTEIFVADALAVQAYLIMDPVDATYAPGLYSYNFSMLFASNAVAPDIYRIAFYADTTLATPLGTAEIRVGTVTTINTTAAGVAATLARTDVATSTRAVPGSAMTLAADAITAGTIAAGAIGASEAPLLGTISTDVTSILAFGAPPNAATVATQVWATATTDGLYTYGAALSRLHRRQRHPFRLLANGTIQYFAVNGVTVETTRAMTDVDGNAITAPAAGDPARAAVEVDV